MSMLHTTSVIPHFNISSFLKKQTCFPHHARCSQTLGVYQSSELLRVSHRVHRLVLHTTHRFHSSWFDKTLYLIQPRDNLPNCLVPSWCYYCWHELDAASSLVHEHENPALKSNVSKQQWSPWRTDTTPWFTEKKYSSRREEEVLLWSGRRAAAVVTRKVRMMNTLRQEDISGSYRYRRKEGKKISQQGNPKLLAASIGRYTAVLLATYL